MRVTIALTLLLLFLPGCVRLWSYDHEEAFIPGNVWDLAVSADGQVVLEVVSENHTRDLYNLDWEVVASSSCHLHSPTFYNGTLAYVETCIREQDSCFVEESSFAWNGKVHVFPFQLGDVVILNDTHAAFTRPAFESPCRAPNPVVPNNWVVWVLDMGTGTSTALPDHGLHREISGVGGIIWASQGAQVFEYDDAWHRVRPHGSDYVRGFCVVEGQGYSFVDVAEEWVPVRVAGEVERYAAIDWVAEVICGVGPLYAVTFEGDVGVLMEVRSDGIARIGPAPWHGGAP